MLLSLAPTICLSVSRLPTIVAMDLLLFGMIAFALARAFIPLALASFAFTILRQSTQLHWLWSSETTVVGDLLDGSIGVHTNQRQGAGRCNSQKQGV